MAEVNMSSLWELIDEVLDHTTQIVGLVILGVVILCSKKIGRFITDILDAGVKGK